MMRIWLRLCCCFGRHVVQRVYTCDVGAHGKYVCETCGTTACGDPLAQRPLLPLRVQLDAPWEHLLQGRARLALLSRTEDDAARGAPILWSTRFYLTQESFTAVIPRWLRLAVLWGLVDVRADTRMAAWICGWSA